MAKPRLVYTCANCNYDSPKWMGRCTQCGEWNTFSDEPTAAAGATTRAGRPVLAEQRVAVPLHTIRQDSGGEVRLRSGIQELDEVLGGGLVAGSLVLLGGDPGVGKSTLTLMALDMLSRKGLPVLYVTGEESPVQVKMRADRLGVTGQTLKLLANTDFTVVEQVARAEKPVAMVLDSVQTMYLPDVQGIPGSMTQVREVAHRAMMLAKHEGIACWLVGHMTKSGQVAGPKLLEHLVDTVLYFEGDGRSGLRVLRSVKNRFGPAGELGLFEMVEDGLREVPDASARLLAERSADAHGTAVIAALEGSRPLLIEIQALVGRPTPSIAGRTCVGVDRTRVLLLAAVLEKAGLALYDRDLFVNAAGGVRVEETAVDLGVVAAIASSLAEQPVRSDTMLFGEVGLVGEVRAVPYPALRLKEAVRHGFKRVIAPMSAVSEAPPGLQVVGVRTIREVLAALF